MGVWLDDEFPEHPKVEALDDDLARWLYVAGLCYANRNLTGGRIPKGAALRLTDKASQRLINKLLATLVPSKGPLWEDHGDHYRIHDYDQHQQSAEKRRAEVEDGKKKRSEHARRAALARHHPDGEHQSSTDRASPEHPPGIDPANPGADDEQGDFLAHAPPRASAAERATPGRPNALVPTSKILLLTPWCWRSAGRGGGILGPDHPGLPRRRSTPPRPPAHETRARADHRPTSVAGSNR